VPRYDGNLLLRNRNKNMISSITDFQRSTHNRKGAPRTGLHYNIRNRNKNMISSITDFQSASCAALRCLHQCQTKMHAVPRDSKSVPVVWRAARLLLLRHLELWGGKLVQFHRDVEAGLCQAVHHRSDVLHQSFFQRLIGAEIFLLLGRFVSAQ
jgi:hypothetical protein